MHLFILSDPGLERWVHYSVTYLVAEGLAVRGVLPHPALPPCSLEVRAPFLWVGQAVPTDLEDQMFLFDQLSRQSISGLWCFLRGSDGKAANFFSTYLATYLDLPLYPIHLYSPSTPHSVQEPPSHSSRHLSVLDTPVHQRLHWHLEQGEQDEINKKLKRLYHSSATPLSG